jgi:hypothetical protein
LVDTENYPSTERLNMDHTLMTDGDRTAEQRDKATATSPHAHADYAHGGDGDISKCPVAHILS